MTDETNLWPSDLLSNKIILPKNILIEQANKLAEMSSSLLVAEVRSVPTTKKISNGNAIREVKALLHEFIVKAPSLGNYQFPLLRIVHEEIHIYPFPLFDILNEKNYNVSDDDMFKERLREIFSSEKTKKTISYIISQV